MRNLVTLPNGEKLFPRFRPTHLGEFGFLRQHQFIQRSLEEIELKLVAERPLTPSEEQQVRDRVARSFRYPFTLTFSYVDELPRLPNGKFEDFVSLVST